MSKQFHSSDSDYTSMPHPLRTQVQVRVTIEEVKAALAILGRNKAKGIDYLGDVELRQLQNSDPVTEKIASAFEYWLNNMKAPSYAK